MKFRSRQDTLFQVISFGISGIFLGLIIFHLFCSQPFKDDLIGVFILMLLTACLLLWVYFDTKYEITVTALIYKSGPIRGQIEIERINEIVKGKTLWVGLKPATARNGLIIKYDKYNEVYISPENNDLLINELLKRNSRIKIKSP